MLRGRVYLTTLAVNMNAYEAISGSYLKERAGNPEKAEEQKEKLKEKKEEAEQKEKLKEQKEEKQAQLDKLQEKNVIGAGAVLTDRGIV